MNKFIALAFFALCATMAHSQVIPGLPYGVYSDLVGQTGGSSASSASSAASASSANNALLNSQISTMPLASGLLPYGTIGAINAYNPWLAGGLRTVGPLGPIGSIAPGLVQLM